MKTHSLRSFVLLSALVATLIVGGGSLGLLLAGQMQANDQRVQARLQATSRALLPLLDSQLERAPALVQAQLEQWRALAQLQRIELAHQGHTIVASAAAPQPVRVLSHNVPLGPDTQLRLSAQAQPSVLMQSPFLLFFLLGKLALVALASLVVLFLYRKQLSHSLNRIAAYLRGQNSILEAPPLALSNSSPREFKDFAAAINRVRSALLDNQQQVRLQTQRYQSLMKDNPDAVWCLHLSQPLKPQALSAQAQAEQWFHGDEALEINAQARTLAAQCQAQPAAIKQVRQLPFLSPALFTELINNNFRLKDFDSHCQLHDGERRYFRNNVSAVIESGRIISIWGIAADTTERVRAQQQLQNRERQLRLSETRLEEAQALAHMGHWSYITASDTLHVSEEFSRIYGFNPLRDRPTWRQLIERMHPQDRDHIVGILSDPHSDAAGAEHRLIWPNGEVRHVQAVARKTVENGAVTASFGIIMDITLRRRAEEQRRESQQALIESEARMAEAQAIAHMGHWVLDYNSKRLSCSDEFFRLHGFAPQSFEPHVRDFVELLHADDKVRMRTQLDAARQKPFTDEYRIVLEGGEIRYMRATVTPFYSGGREISRIFGISMDITEQKLAEMEIKASQEQLSRMFQLSPDGIFVLNRRSGEFLQINQAFADMMATPSREIIGRALSYADICITSKHGKNAVELMRKNTQVSNLEVQFISGDDQRKAALLSWRQVELAGEDCLLANIRDITQLRELERTAAQQQRQLLQADKLASLGTMVAGVAHEINNPNHLIQMNSELLESFCQYLFGVMEELPSPDREKPQANGLSTQEMLDNVPELLMDMRLASRRIDRIVKDLKDFARPQDDAEFLALDLNAVIAKSEYLLAPILDRYDTRVHYDLAPDLATINGDSQRLQQVLVNLVNNACDASLQSGQPLTIRTYRRPQAREVVCEVCDRGSGISAEIREHIFDPFFTTKQSSGGTGLGLAISFNIIRDHGGRLEALANSESGDAQGTIMRFSLPELTDNPEPPAT